LSMTAWNLTDIFPAPGNSSRVMSSDTTSDGVYRPAVETTLGKQQYDLATPVLSDSYQISGQEAVPKEFRHRGWFYWTAQMLRLALKPSSQLQLDVVETMQATRLSDALAGDAPVLGMHVRRGDSCSEDEKARMARTCSPLANYMSEIDEYAQRMGVQTIYLATDSNDVLNETAAYPQYTFIYMRMQRKPPERLIDIVVDERMHAGETYLTQREVHLATLDMLLLSKCDMFVGKFTSNFFRTAYALKAAECDCAVPFVSLDAPWCFDYGVKAGSNFDFPLANPFSDQGAGDNRFWC